MAESLRARALKLLARREHTRRELERKLAADAADPGEIEAVLEEFETRGWLSESRVTEQLVHARKSRYGARRIERDLRDRGVSEDAVAAAVSGLKEGELERARAVWQRKFKRPAAGPQERARQVRFLQGRGFELEVIFKVIKGEGVMEGSDEK
ncbi:MAG TPA: recombination regulator RecX [Burkholderiales bacterium]|nr:recombination regulator RecX [Burkholderiales bacterium]